MRKEGTKKLLPLQIPGLYVRSKWLGRRGPTQENRDSNDTVWITQVCVECKKHQVEDQIKNISVRCRVLIHLWQ